MKQPNFFAMSDRREKLSQMHDFLDRLNEIIDWNAFLPILSGSIKRSDGKNGGRPPYDLLLMFKILVLQSLYNLSDPQTQYQINDRISFMKFLGLELYDTVPDEKTIWLFRENLKSTGVIDELFNKVNQLIDGAGFTASKGQIVDASFVEVPKQRNKKEENEKIKNGEVPEDWSENKKAQKDTEARWTKKNDEDHFGYKNHVSVDNKHKIIRDYKVTDASVHDSQVFDEIIDENNDSNDVWADSAYRSEAQEERLKAKGMNSNIHERAYRGKPLTEEQKAENRKKSSVRVRVEHVFGHIQNSMHGSFVRTIGMARAKVKIGLENIAYNLSRFVFLNRSSFATG